MRRFRPLLPLAALVVLAFTGCATNRVTPEAAGGHPAGYSISNDADGRGYFVRGPEIPIGSADGVRLFSAWNGTSAVYGVFVRTWRRPGAWEPWSGCVAETGRRFATTEVVRLDAAAGDGTTQVVRISLDKQELEEMCRLNSALTLVAREPLSFRIPAEHIREFLKYVDETRSRLSAGEVRLASNRDPGASLRPGN